MQFEDPNDPRYYPDRNPLMPPIGYTRSHRTEEDAGPLMYHDFDYVGYDRKRTPEEPYAKRTGSRVNDPRISGRNFNRESSEKFRSVGARFD